MTDRKPTHTPEPWHSHKGMIVDGDTGVAMCGYTDTGKANAKRIVACVNALQGMNPEAIGGLVKAAELCVPYLDDHVSATYDDGGPARAMRSALANLKGETVIDLEFR